MICPKDSASDTIKQIINHCITIKLLLNKFKEYEMKVQAINNTNRYYNTRMSFGNKTKQATAVAQSAAQKAVPIALTIGGVAYTGATTLEILKSYLSNKLDIPSDKITPDTNVWRDRTADSIELMEIVSDFEKATGADIFANDKEYNKVATSNVQGWVDFLDSHRPVNE